MKKDKFALIKCNTSTWPKNVVKRQVTNQEKISSAHIRDKLISNQEEKDSQLKRKITKDVKTQFAKENKNLRESDI